MRNIPYKNTYLIILGGISLPFLFFYSGSYPYIDTLFYGRNIHIAEFAAVRLSAIFIIVGFFGVILGLIYPRLCLWTGVATRIKASLIYSAIFIAGVLLRYESQYINYLRINLEKENLYKYYNQIPLDITAGELEDFVRDLDSGLHISRGLSTANTQINHLPFSINNHLFSIRYKRTFSRQTLYVEMSEIHADPAAKSKRIMLVDRNQVIQSRPDISIYERQLFWSSMFRDNDRLYVQPCKSDDVYELELQTLNDTETSKLMRYYEDPDYADIRSSAVVDGKISGSCQTCSDGQEKIQIYRFFTIEPEKTYRRYSCTYNL